MSDSNEITTDPDLERRTRRRFSMAEKSRLLAQADGVPYGEKDPWLRRNGLYAGQLSSWRRELAEHGEKVLAPRTPGRRPADPAIARSSDSSARAPLSRGAPRWPSN